ncbi:hypothetical protein [Pseudomonas abietaniphila]|uniref:hypothetical protein n=1 Tax=Pseudomonas abietaniphila TaxID=89065 RepID=UPI000781E123|nr:hypothetical protein [Pseudomonas abietaniphila]
MIPINAPSPHALTSGLRAEEPTPNELERGQANPSRLNAFVQAFRDRTHAAQPHLETALATAGAFVGQMAQQAITCGGPTFMREEVSMQLFSALREKHPAIAVSLQVAMSLATILAHTHVREGRMNRATEHNVGVAGHIGVSRDEFAGLPDDVRARKIASQERDSKAVTRAQISAEALFATVSVIGLAAGNHDLTSRLFATQMRNLVYAATRESGQATLAFTRSSGATHGVNEQNMTKMACAYTVMTLAMGMAQDALARRLLPDGQQVSGGGVSGPDGKQLTGSELQKAIALVATARAVCNTAVEVVDAFLGKHFENKQVGGQQSAQRFDAAALLPAKDYQRLLDHSPTRLAWNNSANAASLIFQQVTNAAGHPAAGVVSLLNNSVSAAAFGLMYPMINQTYQAHAKIRAEVAAAPALPEVDDVVDDETAAPGTPVSETPPRPASNEFVLGELPSTRSRPGEEGSGHVSRQSSRAPSPAPRTPASPLASEHRAGSPVAEPLAASSDSDEEVIEIETPGAALLRESLAAEALEAARSEGGLDGASLASHERSPSEYSTETISSAPLPPLPPSPASSSSVPPSRSQSVEPPSTHREDTENTRPRSASF